MVECDLAKVEVAGSNPVSRSNFYHALLSLLLPGPVPRSALLLSASQLTAACSRRASAFQDFQPASSCKRAPSPSGKAEVCKTSTPGSNPGGASNSNFARRSPFSFPASLRARGRSANANALRPHDFPPALACGRRRFLSLTFAIAC